MFVTFTEFETNIRKERQIEGKAKTKKKGVYKGSKLTAQAKESRNAIMFLD